MTRFLVAKTRTILGLLLVFILIIVVLYPVTSFYFWRDDFFMLHSVRYGIPYPWPHTFERYPYIILHYFFGMAPTGYFVIGIFSRLVIAMITFWLAHRFTGKHSMALLAALLVGISPLGLEGIIMSGVVVSILVAIFLQVVAVIALKDFLDNSRKAAFALSLSATAAGYLLMFHRFATTILVLWSLIAIKYIGRNRAAKESKFRYVQAFFGITFAAIIGFEILPKDSIGQLASFGTRNGRELFTTGLGFGYFFAQAIIPSSVLEHLRVIFGIQLSFDSFSMIVGWVILALLGGLILWQFTYHKKHGPLTLFFVLWILATLTLPAFIAQTFIYYQSRYMAITAVPVSLLLAYLSYFFVQKNRWFGLVVFGIILLYAFSTRTILNEHYQDHGKFAKKFFQEFRANVPSLAPNTFVFIELNPDTVEIGNRIGEFVRIGVLKAEHSLALSYGIKNATKIDLYNSRDPGSQQALEDAYRDLRPVIVLEYNGVDGSLKRKR